LILHSFTKASLFYQVGQVYKFLKTYRLEESGRYLQLNPAGAIVLLIGMFAILAIPPSGMFLSEWMTFKALVASGRWITFSITILFLSFVIYALATRFFHLLYSEPVKECPVLVENGASPWETSTQFLLLGFVVFICFYQPAFLVDLIREAAGF
jgi:hydrogenase-4 component F